MTKKLSRITKLKTGNRLKKCLDCDQTLSARHNCKIELKRQQYQEFRAKHPLPIDHGIEMKECEGCYCQMSHDSSCDFCFDCLDCDSLNCGDYDPNTGNCCACYGGKNKKLKLKRKQLTFTQKQRLHLEKIIRQTQDLIEEIKEQEDPDLWWKRMEDIKRWNRQEKNYLLSELTKEELITELKKRK